MHKLIYFFLLLITLILGSCSYYQYQINTQSSAKTEPKVPKPDVHAILEAPDFHAIKNMQKRKHVFFAYLKPGIEYENQRVRRERNFLLSTKIAIQTKTLSQTEIKQLVQIAHYYNVDMPENGPDIAWFDRALRKVDILPDALVLIQAANESAWGTSRFARKANNYFGQWCYKTGCGLVPLARQEGMTHEVAKFDSVQQSIHRYFMNVNRNKAYQALREIRYQLREDSVDLSSVQSAIQLTNGLVKYSERGQAYVDSLQTMIQHNKKYW